MSTGRGTLARMWASPSGRGRPPPRARSAPRAIVGLPSIRLCPTPWQESTRIVSPARHSPEGDSDGTFRLGRGFRLGWGLRLGRTSDSDAFDAEGTEGTPPPRAHSGGALCPWSAGAGAGAGGGGVILRLKCVRPLNGRSGGRSAVDPREICGISCGRSGVESTQRRVSPTLVLLVFVHFLRSPPFTSRDRLHPLAAIGGQVSGPPEGAGGFERFDSNQTACSIQIRLPVSSHWKPTASLRLGCWRRRRRRRRIFRAAARPLRPTGAHLQARGPPPLMTSHPESHAAWRDSEESTEVALGGARSTHFPLLASSLYSTKCDVSSLFHILYQPGPRQYLKETAHHPSQAHPH